MKQDAFRQRFNALTVGQREVLRWRCEGLQNKEIAERIFRSEQTVKNRLTVVFQKMGFMGGSWGTGELSGGSRSALVCYWLGRHDAAVEQAE